MENSFLLKQMMIPGYFTYQLWLLPRMIRIYGKTYCRRFNCSCSLENCLDAYKGDKKQCKKAINDCKKILRRNPRCALAWNNLSLIYYILDDYDKAIKIAKKVIKLKNNNLVLKFTYCNLGAIYFNKGDLRRALQYFKKAKKIRTRNYYANRCPIVFITVVRFFQRNKNVFEEGTQ